MRVNLHTITENQVKILSSPAAVLMERFFSFKQPLKVILGRQETAMKSKPEDLPHLKAFAELMMTSQRWGA